MSGSGIKDPKHFIPVPQGDSGTFRADATEDLTEPGATTGNLQTLGMYLSDLTAGHSTAGSTAFVPTSPNYFPVSTNQQVLDPSGDGTTRADIPMGGNDSSQDTFTSPTTTEPGAATYFDNLKRGTLTSTPDGSDSSDIFNRNEGIAGHTLLSSVASQRDPFEAGVGDTTGKKTWELPTGATPAQQRISAILGQNRFTPMPGTSPHIEDGEFTDAGAAASQEGLGVYDADSNLTSTEKQRTMALLSLLRATGHRMDGSFPSTTAGLNAVVTPATAVQAGASRVNTRKLRVKYTHNAPESVEIDDAELRYDDITGAALQDQKSVGVLNSPWEPYESFGAGRMMLVTVRAFGRLLVEGAAFVAILALAELVDGATPPGSVESMRYGKHINVGLVGRIIQQMGVPEMRFALWKCYIFGLQRFFGMPDGGMPPGIAAAAGLGIEFFLAAVGAWIAGIAAAIATDPSAAFDTFFNVMWSAGYYASLLRSVNQDLSRLLGDLGDLGASAADNAISAAVRMMFQFNRYSSFRFIIAICQMGNAAMQARTRVFPSAGGQAQLRSTMPDNGRTRVSKGRLRRTNSKTAWRHSSAPALFLVPKKTKTAWAIWHNQYNSGEFKAAMRMVGDNANQPTGADPYQGQRRRPTLDLGSDTSNPYNYTIHGSGARLRKEIVTAMENELDLEYMPFYFHDLRTNEVIGFHAFLEDVKDSYSVAYQSTKGYGRIDPVHIYKDTDRSVSVSWMMVATNEEDFDSLWFSINKLITLLYPQWSKGKRVRAGDHKFIQPFSQIPTASPVVRLRVGDVIRSNYSRFNLARLFGLNEAVQASNVGAGTAESAWADADFDISTATATVDPAATSAAETEAEAAGEAAWAEYQARAAIEPASPSDTAGGYLVGDMAYLKANSSIGYTTWDRGETLESPPPSNATNVEFTPFRSRTYTEGETVSNGTVLKRNWLGDAEGDAMSSEGAGGAPKTAEYVFRFEDRDSMADPYRPASSKNHWHEYVVTGNDLVPMRAEDPPPEPVEGTVNFGQQVTNVSTFFDPSNNAIVSSFEEGMGKGLAGVITSFDMDWKDFIWETDKLGARAPQALRVSISFSPIHDIVPGLDHTGFPRVMNYPVGRIAGRVNSDRYAAGRGNKPVGSPSPDPIDSVRTEFNNRISESFGTAGSPGTTVETDD